MGHEQLENNKKPRNKLTMTTMYVTATPKLPQGQFRHLPERTLPQRTFLVCFPNFRDNYFCNLTLFVN